MSHYIYCCFDCKKEYSAYDIESGFHYLCPECGKAEKNQPLHGVLSIKYDYDSLKHNLNRETFLTYSPGKFWLYPELWPLRVDAEDKLAGISSDILNRLTLSSGSMVRYDYNDNLIYLQDETRNPTLSFKDRASIITAVKAIQLGIKEICAASTGNAGSSIAGICARLGIKSHIFVPVRIPDAKRIQIQSFGANIYLVEGSYDDAFDLSLEIAAKKNWFSRNTAHNPLTIEGKKWGAYDIFISSGGNIPDVLFIPVGDGVIISGIYKGFSELIELGWTDKLPKLIAVQASGSDALARYLRTGVFEFQEADTIADSISAGAPRNLYMAAEAVKRSEGKAIVVTDDEILSAQKIMAQQFGILTEPSSAACFAGYLKMLESSTISGSQKLLLLITGNGLKDVQTLNKWNEKPEAKSNEDWLQSIG